MDVESRQPQDSSFCMKHKPDASRSKPFGEGERENEERVETRKMIATGDCAGAVLFVAQTR